MTSTLFLQDLEKWYTMHVRHDKEDGTFEIRAVSFSELEDVCRPGESPYADHVPNPYPFVALAKKNDWLVDYGSLERLIGRWEFESTNNYDDLELP